MAVMASSLSPEMASRSTEIRSTLLRVVVIGALSNRLMTAKGQSSTRANGPVLGFLQISVAVVRVILMVRTSAYPTFGFQGLWFKGQNRGSVLARSQRHHPPQRQVHHPAVGSLAMVAFAAILMEVLHSFALTANSASIVELMHASALVRGPALPQAPVPLQAVIAAGLLEVRSVERAMAAFAGANVAVIAAGLQVVHNAE
jgi:hypothetical protein